MSDSIEHDGKHYVEVGYLEMANNNTKRACQEAQQLRQQLVCDVCCGKKDRNCICGGTGDALVGRQYLRERVVSLESELVRETARLNKLLSMWTPYFIRGQGHVQLVETDCGAMIVHGEGKDERAAIDAALATDAALKPQQQEWSDESMRSAMMRAAKENGADV